MQKTISMKKYNELQKDYEDYQKQSAEMVKGLHEEFKKQGEKIIEIEHKASAEIRERSIGKTDTLRQLRQVERCLTAILDQRETIENLQTRIEYLQAGKEVDNE